MKIYQICGKAGSGKTTVANAILGHYSFEGKFVAKIGMATELKNMVQRYLFITKYGLVREDFNFGDLVEGVNDLLSVAVKINSLYRKGDHLVGSKMDLDSFPDIRPHAEEVVNGIMKAKSNPELIPAVARMTLQKVGTEFIRMNINPDYWVDRVVEKSNALYDMGCDILCVDDYRFPNEDMTKFDVSGEVLRVKLNVSDLERKRRLGVSDEVFADMQGHQSETMVDKLKFDIVYNNTKDKDINQHISEIVGG